MKEKNTTMLLLVGVLTFVFSILIDDKVNSAMQYINIAFLDLIFSTITNFGVVIVVMVVVPSIMLYAKDKKLFYLLLLTLIISVLLSVLLKFIVLRQRPEDIITYPFTALISYSFPSMHALVMFSLLPILVEYLPKQKNFWTAFAFLIAFTRIYFRLHFLSDVVFGALIGYLLGILHISIHKKGKIWKTKKVN